MTTSSDARRALLSAALGFVLLKEWQSVRELVMLHAWLDSWNGIGLVVVGMERHGYDLSLTRDQNGGVLRGPDHERRQNR